jgi:abhydrolase domain-containing protein 12
MGLASAGKTLNLNLQTSDNVSIGAWFMLAEGLYQPLPQDNHTEVWPSLIPSALSTRPTVLYLHGNAMNRAYHSRIRLYGAWTSRLRANILAIDYRGFGNSEGSPTEEGLALDARAAWDWLIINGARPEDILLAGHSLGTAISTRLAASLTQEQVAYKGLVLMSPFSSITTLLDTYHLFGFVPLMSPLRMIRGASSMAHNLIISQL